MTRAMPTLAPDHSVSMTRTRGNKALSEIIVDGVIKLSENLGREAAVDGKETSVIFMGSSVPQQITEDNMKPKKSSFETISESQEDKYHKIEMD